MSLKKWLNRNAFRRYAEYVDAPLQYFVDLLEKDRPFAFSRFGDGEWNAILERTGANCDGHEYYPQLGERLRDAVRSRARYYFGIQDTAVRRDGVRITRFLRRNDVHRRWHNADVLHHANRDGVLYPFISAIRKKPVVIIGPEHLRNLSPDVFAMADFIAVPDRNCFLAVDDIIAEVNRTADNQPVGRVYAFSASMAANVIMHELYKRLGEDNWLIDCGSLWDPYVGVKSRGYFSRPEWESKKALNLG